VNKNALSVGRRKHTEVSLLSVPFVFSFIVMLLILYKYSKKINAAGVLGLILLEHKEIRFIPSLTSVENYGSFSTTHCLSNIITCVDISSPTMLVL
jgi:lipoprotein signal peptidase